MKKIYTYISLISLFLLPSLLNAQDFSVKKEKLSTSGAASKSKIATQNVVYNNTSKPITLIWKKNENIPIEWSIEICDNTQCYGSDTDSAEFTLDANDSGTITVDFIPNGKAASGTVDVYIYKKGGNYNNGIKTVNTLETWTDAIDKLKNTAKFSMYPSPVRNYLTIKFDKKGKHEIEIYNILGRRVMHREVNNANYMKISFASLKNGMYIVMHRDENNNVITKTISRER